MTLAGKGFYLWKIRRCEGGDPAKIAALAVQAGFSHVLIKVADGVGSYNIDPDTGADLVGPVVDALRSRGIQVWGWHYVYGYNPLGEADKAIQRAKQFNLDGYTINAEVEYKQPGRAEAARKFMDRLRRGLPNTPLALSSYRFPTYHPQIPWKVFLERCDYNMPQVYWLGAHNAGEQLLRCLSEFQALAPYRPIIPTGAAFAERGWEPTTAEVTEFMSQAQAMGLAGVNFWEWSNTRLYLPDVWQTVTDYVWPGDVPTPEPVPEEEPMNAEQFGELSGKLDKIIGLLTKDQPKPQPTPEPEPTPEPKPVYTKVKVKSEKALAHFAASFNGAAVPAPIMEIYPTAKKERIAERIKFTAGDLVSVVGDKIRADGGSLWWMIGDRAGDQGQTLYINAADVSKQ